MTPRHALLIMVAMAFALALSGCAFVDMSLMPGVKPMHEVTVQGTGKDKILIIEITGVISHNEKKQMLGATEPSMPASVKEQLDMARKDERIRGLILRINTPGGGVAATDVIYHEVMDYKRATGAPVYAGIVGMGTSGGYYIASAADRIIAQPASLTGGIGVIAISVNLEGLMDKIGVKDKTYKSGDKKALMSPFRADTPEEHEIIQSIIDGMFSRFLEVVVQGRKGRIDRQEVARLADGRPYTAEQALQNRLIDGLGYPNDVIDDMKLALGLTDASIIMYARPTTYKGSIYAMQGVSGNTFVNLDAEWLREFGGVRFMYMWQGGM